MLRHPRPLSEIAWSRMQEGEVTGKTEEYEWEREGEAWKEWGNAVPLGVGWQKRGDILTL